MTMAWAIFQLAMVSGKFHGMIRRKLHGFASDKVASRGKDISEYGISSSQGNRVAA